MNYEVVEPFAISSLAEGLRIIKNLDTHVEQHGSVTVYDLKLLLAVQPLLHDRYFGWKSIDDFGVYRNARNGRWFIRVAPPVSLT